MAVYNGDPRDFGCQACRCKPCACSGRAAPGTMPAFLHVVSCGICQHFPCVCPHVETVTTTSTVDAVMIVDPDEAAKSLSDEDVERIARRVAELLRRPGA